MNIPTLFSGSFPTDGDVNSVKIESNLSGISSRLKQPYVKIESNLSGISSQLKQPYTAVGRDRRSDTHGFRQGSEENWSSSGTRVLDQGQSPVDDANLCSTSPVCAAPIIKQFWKAGVYNDVPTSKSTTQYGSAYLHIHPRFLHSNATSHKWVFGAVAELIDNAVDEIQNGATYVIIDKTTNPRNGSTALLIQDDGKGMDPEAMRRCLSFGFSDKCSADTIGKYGNGFKTSSMRLGADVIVFSRNVTDRTVTQSIGLLSYTFLTRLGYDRIVVPMVHYEFNFNTNSFECLQSKNRESNLNLSLLLQWSPYSTEKELLKQFENVGSNGTKVIVYNLWLDEDGNTELDFDSDPKDIRITRDGHAQKKDAKAKDGSSIKHLANRLRFSLRAYLSILYLKMPATFAIVLREEVILYHNVATDLKYTEFIMYTPQSAPNEGSVVTTIGFLKEAPNINVHGFLVYHKNRLILPFFHAINFSNSRGRGVVGILEANFIEPTHDKQDFEKTAVFQKLVQRLKEMALEYWDYHCGLLGYHVHKKPRAQTTTPSVTKFQYQHSGEQPPVPMRKRRPDGDLSKVSQLLSTLNSKVVFESVSLPKPVQPGPPPGFQQGSNLKRKSSDQPTMVRSKSDSNKKFTQPGLVNTREATDVMEENRKLRDQCAEFEKAEEQFKLKVEQLRMELEAAEVEYLRLLAEAKHLESVKEESYPFRL